MYGPYCADCSRRRSTRCLDQPPRLFAVDLNAVEFDFDQPLRVEQAFDFDQRARRLDVGKHLAVDSCGIFPVLDVGQHYPGANHVVAAPMPAAMTAFTAMSRHRRV
jgi:hypothetical protein